MKNKKKQLLGILLSLSLVLGLMLTSGLSLPVYAAPSSIDGTTNLTWELSDEGILTISGTGEMIDYGVNDPPWKDYKESIKSIVVENGVTKIGKCAFSASMNYCSDALTQVTIPSSVTSVGDQAFEFCDNLATVTFTPAEEGNTLIIGSFAFTGNTKIAYGTGTTRLYDGDTEIQAGALLSNYNNKTLTWKTVVASVTSGSTTTEYTNFDKAVDNWSKTNGATLTLLADVETANGVSVNSAGGTRIIDLNGYGIRYSGENKKPVIQNIDVALTLKDSAASTRTHYITLNEDGRGVSVADSGTESATCIKVTGGYITGGNTAGNEYNSGGGVCAANGNFTMEGGTIVGNTADEGGGVWLGGTNPTITMNGGAITGNKATHGGGVYVNSGNFNMTGGTITGNKATYGGGVNVNTRGKFTMDGGTISENKATSKGGGVSNLGTFEMNGGKIKGNKAEYYAGVRIDGGSFKMTDGEIDGNIASAGIGGVYVYNSATFTMTGGKIENNEAAGYCGGVYIMGTFNLSGSPIIKDNKIGTGDEAKDNNVFLETDKKISVTDELSNTASIGVSMKIPGVFTNSENVTLNDASKFSSDDADYVVVKNDSNQLELSPAYTVTYKVVNGTWSDDTTTDKTEAVASGSKPVDVPTGMKASEGYTGGAWDKKPTETAITEATTFTYTFEAKTDAAVKTAPTAKDLTYNGQPQKLVTEGTAEGGEMQYAIGKDATTAPTDGWSASVPTETSAGSYYVWYMVKGDEAHLDTVAKCIEVTINEKTEYYNASGDNITLDPESDSNPTFSVKGKPDDSTTFDHFTGIKVDKKDVSKDNYTATKGSVIISLKQSYIETLSAGEHMMTVMFDDADPVDISFTVSEKKAEDDAEETNNDIPKETDEEIVNDKSSGEEAKPADIEEKADDKPAAEDKTDSTAKTGDSTEPLLLFMIMLDSALAVVYLTLKKKTRKMNK